MSCAWYDVPCLIQQAAATIGSVAGGAAAAADAATQAAINDLAANIQDALIGGGSALEQLGNTIASELTQTGGTPPLVIKQSADDHVLITQAFADGWSIVTSKTLHPDVGAALAAGHLQLDAIEWKDLAFLGLGNVDLAASQFERYIAAQGSQLYAWAVMQHVDFDEVGVEIKAYRLLLLHSQIQIGAGAIIAIVVAAFLAVVIWQYVTTGSSPVLDELSKVWHDLVTSTVNPIATAATEWYVIAAGAAGVIALAFGLAGKRLGVAPPPPPKPPSFEGEVKTKLGRFGART